MVDAQTDRQADRHQADGRTDRRTDGEGWGRRGERVLGGATYSEITGGNELN